MARNVEIKARLNDIDRQREIAKRISGSAGETIHQTDVFFDCDNGRLKLRVFSPDRGELIFYRRPDQTGPKTSEYYISTTDQPDQLHQVLSKAYGEHATIKKTRELFLIERTRVHLDDVEGLGTFLEFEVVLDDTESDEQGRAEASDLMNQFELTSEMLIDCAYVDLMKSAP